MGSLPNSASHDVGTILGYLGEEIDAFLTRARSEQIAVSAAVAAGRAEVESLRATLASATLLRDRLGNLVLEAQREAAARRTAVDHVVAEIVQAAEAEAERILTAARAEAATLRATHRGHPSVGKNGSADRPNSRVGGEA